MKEAYIFHRTNNRFQDNVETNSLYLRLLFNIDPLATCCHQALKWLRATGKINFDFTEFQLV